jgi:nucleoid DNA-binding protein
MKRLLRDVAREAVKKAELPQYEVKKVITAVQEAILDFLVNGDTVIFGDLGVFGSKIMRAHKVRNPKTGETWIQPATRRAHFRFYPEPKEKIRANRRGLDDETSKV